MPTGVLLFSKLSKTALEGAQEAVSFQVEEGWGMWWQWPTLEEAAA
jgi:hypothetical protein